LYLERRECFVKKNKNQPITAPPAPSKNGLTARGDAPEIPAFEKHNRKEVNQ
jgi:hypothetical protein